MTATLTDIRDAISRICQARERVMPHRSTDAIISVLAEASRKWQIPDNHYLVRAIDQSPPVSGFSTAMVREAVNLTFGAITTESLGELVDRELGNRRVIDEFSLRGRIQTRAIGPRLIVHVLAGNVPLPGITSICCGLLLKSANLVKMSSRDPVFPSLFLESIREVDAELADCVAAFEWPREESGLIEAALASTDAVIAQGDDGTLAALRKLAPVGAKFIGYGHKISFAVIAKEAMTAENLPALAEDAAFDASVYDQQGCLSPHVFYVEERGQLGPRKFAAELSQAMANYQAQVPRGTLTVEEAAQVAKLREAYLFRSASDRRVAVWASHTPNEWTVIYDDDPSFAASCLNRVVFVKPTDGFKRVLDSVQRYAGQISTVGLAPMNERATAFAVELARMGVHRVCPIGKMQQPPLAWHHDGRPNLADLVRWTDLG